MHCSQHAVCKPAQGQQTPGLPLAASSKTPPRCQTWPIIFSSLVNAYSPRGGRRTAFHAQFPALRSNPASRAPSGRKRRTRTHAPWFRRARSPPPQAAYVRCTVIRFCVTVPVLSTHSTLTAPSVSTPGRLRTSDRFRASRHAPMDRNTVRITGTPPESSPWQG